MDEMSCLSKSGVQFAPPSSVFQTPPATAPKYQVFGSPSTPSIARARPPRNGPTCRHCIPLKSFSSIAPAGVAVVEGLAARVGEGEEVTARGDGLTANALEQTKRKATKTRWPGK